MKNLNSGTETTVQEGDESESETMCPLFMTGLPSNFKNNSALVAIASFLDHDIDVTDEKNIKKTEESTKIAPVAGGGKLRRNPRQHSRHSRSPYKTPIKKKKAERKATLGEAQLFLNMWKI